MVGPQVRRAVGDYSGLVMDAVEDREVCVYVCVCVRGRQCLNHKVEGVGLQIDEGKKADQKKPRGGGVWIRYVEVTTSGEDDVAVIADGLAPPNVEDRLQNSYKQEGGPRRFLILNRAVGPRAPRFVSLASEAGGVAEPEEQQTQAPKWSMAKMEIAEPAMDLYHVGARRQSWYLRVKIGRLDEFVERNGPGYHGGRATGVDEDRTEQQKQALSSTGQIGLKAQGSGLKARDADVGPRPRPGKVPLSTRAGSCLNPNQGS
ncbi:hypothetical protein GQ607_016460 [Colletotrichum asianum]|uniref:Uncharacterized protein n=1 Tax=Colletotrichum asianum TaxID=702518 RepID=A0A8H3VWM2_9PEZI|nr:hypothetical protein GQ607_016460 [Colletotrichum asianum]